MDIGSGPGGLAKASAAIAAGMCDVVVYIWGWAGHRIGPKSSPVPTKAPRIGEWRPSRNPPVSVFPAQAGIHPLP